MDASKIEMHISIVCERCGGKGKVPNPLMAAWKKANKVGIKVDMPTPEMVKCCCDNGMIDLTLSWVQLVEEVKNAIDMPSVVKGVDKSVELARVSAEEAMKAWNLFKDINKNTKSSFDLVQAKLNQMDKQLHEMTERINQARDVPQPVTSGDAVLLDGPQGDR